MKINENIVLSMVAPHVVDNALTYEKFDELFAMLSRSEQYSVTDLLAAHHIELRDADDDLAQAYATEFTADSADQPLFDHSVSCAKGKLHAIAIRPVSTDITDS